jgi:hypothetical protein
VPLRTLSPRSPPCTNALQSQAFELIDELIIARQKEDITGYNRIVATANDLIGRYNANIQRIEELTRPL